MYSLTAAYGEQADFQDQERFSVLFDALRDVSTSEDRGSCIISTCNDHNRYKLNNDFDT